jgi:DNA mismatch endonuclease, patch repair protein
MTGMKHDGDQDQDQSVDPRRSALMRRVTGKNTTPELKVRSALHRAGFRFRLHRKDLPGRPDIVLPSRQAIVFVHGCFWHRHQGCKAASVPNTRTEFWANKFKANVQRDARVQAQLEQQGWRCHVVWECETKRQASFWPSLEHFLQSR